MRKTKEQGFKNFWDLNAWKKAREFRNEVSQIVKEKFPEVEKYKLTDQIIRSSRSICANIAEGHGRFHYKDNVRFCQMARGSLNETLDHFICAFDEGYIDRNELKKFKEEFEVCLKILNGYISYLKSRK